MYTISALKESGKLQQNPFKGPKPAIGTPGADNNPLALANRQNLAEQVADAIVDAIASGKLLPGERLIEKDIAALLSVSRVPLREALKILETQGIVSSTPHRGSRVADFDAAKIDRICEVRVALERIALRDAMTTYRAEPDRLHKIDQLITAMERAAEQLDWATVSKADLEFHREICRASGNVVVATLWEALARHVLIVFGNEIRGEKDAAILGPQHRRLRAMLLTPDYGAMCEEIERHILRLRDPQRHQIGP